jgi:hypothetical protein
MVPTGTFAARYSHPSPWNEMNDFHFWMQLKNKTIVSEAKIQSRSAVKVFKKCGERSKNGSLSYDRPGRDRFRVPETGHSGTGESARMCIPRFRVFPKFCDQPNTLIQEWRNPSRKAERQFFTFSSLAWRQSPRISAHNSQRIYISFSHSWRPVRPRVQNQARCLLPLSVQSRLWGRTSREASVVNLAIIAQIWELWSPLKHWLACLFRSLYPQIWVCSLSFPCAWALRRSAELKKRNWDFIFRSGCLVRLCCLRHRYGEDIITVVPDDLFALRANSVLLQSMVSETTPPLPFWIAVKQCQIGKGSTCTAMIFSLPQWTG